MIEVLQEMAGRGVGLCNARLAAWIYFGVTNGATFEAEGQQPGQRICVTLRTNVTVLCNASKMGKQNEERGWRIPSPLLSKGQEREHSETVQAIDALLRPPKKGGHGPCHVQSSTHGSVLQASSARDRRIHARSVRASDAKKALKESRALESSLLPQSFVSALCTLQLLMSETAITEDL